MPPKISGIVSAKKILKRKLVRKAARKYTHVWDQVIKEAMGVIPKTNKIPPNFKGNQNEKFRRALLYKNRLVNYALKHPKSYPYLYRGIRSWEANQYKKSNTLNKNTLTSFSKSKKVAKNFADPYKNTNKKLILILRSNKPIPSINFTNGEFQSEYAPGGKFANMNEREVLLPPGKFTIGKAIYNKNEDVIKAFVKFRARNYVPKPKPIPSFSFKI
jgi:hypothetical protein